MGFYQGNNISNMVFSMLIMFSVIVIFLGSPINLTNPINLKDWERIKKFAVVCLFSIVVLHNVLGFVQYFFNPFDHFPREDAFIGFYGRHGIAQHGLALINGYFVLYYVGLLLNSNAKKRVKEAIYLLFFLISHILCFYGLGFIILVCTILVFISVKYFSVKNLIKIALIGVALVSLFSYFFTGVYKYMIENISYLFILKQDVNFETVYVPGKIRAWLYYYDTFVVGDIPLLLFGTGPGGFNSRISFLLNIDSSNLFVNIFGSSMPYFHKEIIYPLWDMSVISMGKFNDGTRNQPFSSLLALLSEYGIIFTFLLIRIFREVIKDICESINDSGIKDFIYLVSIYVLINVVFDNFLEFSESWVFFIFLFFVKINNLVLKNSISSF